MLCFFTVGAKALSVQLQPLTSLTDHRLPPFLAAFTADFADNQQLSQVPWRYFSLPHFQFMLLANATQILAVRVTSSHATNQHLNFLYVDQHCRSQGFGELLLNDWQQQRSRDLLTIHVKTSLTRTRDFYLKQGFSLHSTQTPASELQAWVTQCQQFNAETYADAILLAKDCTNYTAPL